MIAFGAFVPAAAVAMVVVAALAVAVARVVVAARVVAFVDVAVSKGPDIVAPAATGLGAVGFEKEKPGEEDIAAGPREVDIAVSLVFAVVAAADIVAAASEAEVALDTAVPGDRVAWEAFDTGEEEALMLADIAAVGGFGKGIGIAEELDIGVVGSGIAAVLVPICAARVPDQIRATGLALMVRLNSVAQLAHAAVVAPH